jgi:ribonuclease HI
MGEWEKIGAAHLIRTGITPMWKREIEAKRILLRERKPNSFKGTPNQMSAYRKILEEEVREGVVIPVRQSFVKFWNRTFLVPKRGGEYRKVLNCRRINSLMEGVHFKMEDVRTVRELLLPNDFAVSLDLKSAYSHVPVHQDLIPFLGFRFDGKDYVYKAMPFGLKDAPRVFTKIMRSVIWQIRRRWNIRCVMYLDDLLFLHQDSSVLAQTIQEIAQWMDTLGWTINKEKSEMEPKQVCHFLGWEWDSVGMTVRLGDEKRNGLRELVRRWKEKMRRCVMTGARDLAAVVGSLNATRLQFETASLYLVKMNRIKDTIVRKEGWDGKGRLTPMVGGELEWWSKVLKANEPKSLTSEGKPDIHMWVDASPSGWGAWVHTPQGRIQALGKWPECISQQTNNFRELWAVVMAVKRFASFLTLSQVHHIRLHSDNMAVVYNIARKAAARNLYPALRHLLNLCNRLDLHLSVEHVAGVENGVADSLSRLSRSGDYTLIEEKYQEMCETLGVTPTIDLFATAENAKLPQFISPHAKDQTGVRDALSIPWSQGLPFLHPPIPLVARCLRKILEENVAAVIVLPHWKGQSWSVLLQRMTAQQMILGKSDDVLRPGKQMTEKGDKIPPGYLAAHLLLPPFMI